MSNFGGIPKSEVGIRGNIPSYGKVILYDDIEGVLKWTSVSDPVGGAVTKDTAIMFTKGAALKFVTDSGTPADGDVIKAYRYMPIKASKRLSLELVFRFEDKTLNDEIDFQFTFYDGTNKHQGVLRYLVSGNKWQYLNSANTIADITGGAQKLYAEGWHYLKFVIDFETDKYVSLQTNDLIVDMSAISIYTVASGVEELLEIQFAMLTATTTECTVYVDEVLVTEAE